MPCAGGGAGCPKAYCLLGLKTRLFRRCLRPPGLWHRATWHTTKSAPLNEAQSGCKLSLLLLRAISSLPLALACYHAGCGCETTPPGSESRGCINPGRRAVCLQYDTQTTDRYKTSAALRVIVPCPNLGDSPHPPPKYQHWPWAHQPPVVARGRPKKFPASTRVCFLDAARGGGVSHTPPLASLETRGRPVRTSRCIGVRVCGAVCSGRLCLFVRRVVAGACVTWGLTMLAAAQGE